MEQAKQNWQKYVNIWSETDSAKRNQMIDQIVCEDLQIDIGRHQMRPLAQARLGRRRHPMAMDAQDVCHPFPTPAAMPGAVHQHEGLALACHVSARLCPALNVASPAARVNRQ